MNLQNNKKTTRKLHSLHAGHSSLNLNVRGLNRSATVAINEFSNSLRAQGRTVYKLGLGQSPFPVPECVVEALRANAHQKDYLEVQGLRQLRQAVADFHHRSDNVRLDPDLVIVGPGSKELMFLLQVAYYGDLIIPTPCWVSYAPQAQIVGHRVMFVPTRFEDRFRLMPKMLETICAADPERPRAVVLNYPGNPDGLTYSEKELKKLAAVARKYDLILLADEIYGKINHEGNHVSVARFYPEGTILSSGLSKWCGAGGWRLGTFAFPQDLKWLLNAVASLASETYTSTSAPIQHAAVRAFQGGEEIDRYLFHVRRILKALGRHVAERLRESGARLHDPEGAFYVFPDFSPIADKLENRRIHGSQDLCRRALEETGVAFLPGADFGRPSFELTARIAYVDFDGAAALAAAAARPPGHDIDQAFLRQYCADTLTAVDRLCLWLAKKPSRKRANHHPDDTGNKEMIS